MLEKNNCLAVNTVSANSLFIFPMPSDLTLYCVGWWND